MKLLHVHPTDRAWLRRWLRSNISFFVVATALLVAVRYQPEMPSAPRVSASEHDQGRGETLSVDSDFGRRAGDGPSPVAPEGWRRTSDGWEHVSTWPSIKSINQLIAEQHALEPEWARLAFARMRRISPLMLALLQITAIAAIVNVARSRAGTGASN